MTIEAGLTASEAMQQLADVDDGPEETIDDGAEIADDIDVEEYADADDIPAEVDADGAEELTEGEDEEGEPVEPETVIDPPSFMDATQRDQFANLPTEAQQLVVRQSQMVQADYTRKSQEIAVKNKALDTRIQQLGALKTGVETRLSEWQQVDWVALKHKVSADEYLSYQAQYEQEVQEYQNLNSAYETQRAETVRAHTEAQLQQLPTIFPEAMDPKKGPEIVKEIQTALLEADMTAEGLSMVTAKQMRLVHDALQWRKAQAKRTTLRPKTDAKTTSRPMKAKARASSSNKPGKRSQAFKSNPSKGNAMAALMDID